MLEYLEEAMTPIWKYSADTIEEIVDVIYLLHRNLSKNEKM